MKTLRVYLGMISLALGLTIFIVVSVLKSDQPFGWDWSFPVLANLFIAATWTVASAKVKINMITGKRQQGFTAFTMLLYLCVVTASMLMPDQVSPENRIPAALLAIWFAFWPMVDLADLSFINTWKPKTKTKPKLPGDMLN